MFLNVIYPRDSYFYSGYEIILEQRTDKAAIILNSNTYSKNFRESILSSLVPSEEIKEVSDNVYLINFTYGKSEFEIQNLSAALTGINPIIKFVTPVYYGESQRVTQIPGDEIVVKLRSNVNKEFLDVLNARNSVQIIGAVADEYGFLLKTNDGVRLNALELSAVYFSTGLFEYAEPNFMYPEQCILNYTPNDPYYPKQWALNNTGQTIQKTDSAYGDLGTITVFPGADMNVNLAWDYTKGNLNVKIGYTDTGIDSTHPDFNTTLQAHLLTGYDAVYNKYGVPKDSGFYGGHGTCSGGILGAVGNNSVGVSGIAPDCRLMAIRIFNTSGTSTSVGIARAFDTARVQGIDVISNGWNGFTVNSTVTNAINNAALNGRGGLGCIIFFSAGNEGRRSVWYPSYLPNVVSVGASTTHDQKKAPGTGNQFDWGCNYGEDANGDLDLVTPSICYTTDIPGSYGYSHDTGPEGSYYKAFGGTSCTCPNAAGVAALILSVNTAQSRNDVIDKLFRGCDKIDNIEYSVNKTYGKWSEYCGYGRVNALNSVRLAAGVDVTPPSINHRAVASHSSTYPTKVSAEIVDHNGASVPFTGNNQPKLFYRINKNNQGWSAFDSVNASLRTGNNFDFYIPCQGYETHVQYYLRAHDNSGNYTTFPKGAPDNFWLSYFAVASLTTATNKIGSFVCNDPGVTFSPTVNFGNFIILDTKVQIYLRHARIGDEIIQLYSPISDAHKNRKSLFASNGGTAANITGAKVSDSAGMYWTSGTPPYVNGTFKSDYILNGYNGTNASGNWKILNYDQYSGIQGTYDSVRITFTRSTLATSACARLNSAGDSILNFGTVNIPDSVQKDFYIKNSGTANLSVSNVTFTGLHSSKFSVVGSLPAAIAPNDSGLIKVKLISNSSSNVFAGYPEEPNDAMQGAVMYIYNNDPSKPVFKVSLQTDNPLPSQCTLQLKVFLDGFYRKTIRKMSNDTLTVYLRDNVSPYSKRDSSKKNLDSLGNSNFTFYAYDGVNYYLQLKHRNSLETWSKSPGQSFSSSMLSYDFTTQINSAYGSNLKKIDSLPNTYGIYGGDVDQNGAVDVTDMIAIFNDAQAFALGHVITDITGDEAVDLIDLIVAFNNANDFAVLIRP